MVKWLERAMPHAAMSTDNPLFKFYRSGEPSRSFQPL